MIWLNTNNLTLLFPVSVALRKIDTIHHHSVDKPSQPPEFFQKSPQTAETPHKAPPPEKPFPGDLPPKPQISDLPPKPGELPPKPQLCDLPPKPHLADLRPKPQIKDLPPKPQLSDIPPKPSVADPVQRPQSGEVTPKLQPPDTLASNQQGELVPKQPSEDTNGTPPSATEMPVPLPRKINTVSSSAGLGSVLRKHQSLDLFDLNYSLLCFLVLFKQSILS